MPPVHVLHLCYHSAVRMGILRSQVIVPMALLARTDDLAITIVSGERVGERDAEAERALAVELREEGVGIDYFQKSVGPGARHQRATFLQRLLLPALLWKDSRRLTRLVFDFATQHQPCVVHARSYVPALAAVPVKKGGLCRLIFDPRGCLPEELQFANGWGNASPKFRWWKRAERRILDAADAVIAVSPPMADHFQRIAGPEPALIRNCVDLTRFTPDAPPISEREPLRLIFLVGVDVPYQASEECVALVEILAELWPGGVELRIVTPDAEQMRERIRHPLISIESLPRDAIPRALAESHIGVITRDRTLGSRVACPVKFAEYLASGLPVIATPGIGEIDEILETRNLGCTVDFADREKARESLQRLLTHLTAHGATVRETARATAEELFAWKTYLPTLRRLYGVGE